MYYIVYGFFYLISLLPFTVLYFISDGIAFFLYHILKYRRDVVLSNLVIAFPDKTLLEHKKIAKQFYRNFTDTFIETIKSISLSEAEFDKRCFGNFDVINELVAKDKNTYLVGAHVFNWEYANLVLSKQVSIAPIGVYATIESKIFERFILKLRSRFGTNLISARDFKLRREEISKKQYCMFLLADQNPHPLNSVWMNFFGRPAPFIPGPHKAAIKNSAAMIYINIIKVKRGYYSFSTDIFIENAADFTVEELVRKYRDFVEGMVRKQPENYLWSHRRWKYNFNEIQEKSGGVLVAD